MSDDAELVATKTESADLSLLTLAIDHDAIDLASLTQIPKIAATTIFVGGEAAFSRRHHLTISRMASGECFRTIRSL